MPVAGVEWKERCQNVEERSSFLRTHKKEEEDERGSKRASERTNERKRKGIF